MPTRDSILKNYAPLSSRFKGADMSGEDISGLVLIGADLGKINLSGAYGDNVDLRCADLTEANLEGAQTSGWNCLAANMTGVNLAKADIGGTMHFVKFESAVMDGIHWRRGGHAGARGVILPKVVDFSTWTGGQGFHAGVAKLIEQNTDDVGALRACDYILGQSYRFYYHKSFPCWVGLVEMCHRELSASSIDAIHDVFKTVPNMRLMSMWKIAERDIDRGAK